MFDFVNNNVCLLFDDFFLNAKLAFYFESRFAFQFAFFIASSSLGTSTALVELFAFI